MSDKVMIERAVLENLLAGWDEGLWGPGTQDAGVPETLLGIIAGLRAAALAPASSERAAAGVLERNPKEEIWKGHFDHSALRLELRAGLAGDETAALAYEEAAQVVRDEYVKAVMRVVALTAPTATPAPVTAEVCAVCRGEGRVLDLLPQWEAWRAKWWTRADEERSQYALGVTAALGDCLDDLRRVLDIPEDEPAPAPAVAE